MVQGDTSGLVSAVITTFDRLDMAKRAIRGVMAQTYRSMEIIVVEDGSTSGVEGWLGSTGLTGVRYVAHSARKGLSAARNTGLRCAKGEYVAYLDDDDEWVPDKVARQMAVFQKENRNCVVVYCGAVIVSQSGQIVGRNLPRLHGDIREAIRLKGLFTIPSSCLFRKDALERIGGYDETLFSHVDHDIWLRLARWGYAADYVDQCLVMVYQHDEYRMTEDARARVRATCLFCQTWHADLEKWFGAREARRYCSRFKGRVMDMLGSSFLQKKRRAKGAKYFLLALGHDPGKREYYLGLATCLVGHRLYERAANRWRAVGGKAGKKCPSKGKETREWSGKVP